MTSYRARERPGMNRSPGRLRIIAGDLRGRMIDIPPGNHARPTSSRVREALFSILTHMEPGVQDSRILDACAGSGALGFEALSRGADHVTLLDSDRRTADAITANGRALNVVDRITVRRADAKHPPRAAGRPCNILFLDPPYDSDVAALAPSALAATGWIGPDTLVVIETRRATPVLPETGFETIYTRDYGDTSVYFQKFSG